MQTLTGIGQCCCGSCVLYEDEFTEIGSKFTINTGDWSAAGTLVGTGAGQISFDATKFTEKALAISIGFKLPEGGIFRLYGFDGNKIEIEMRAVDPLIRFFNYGDELVDEFSFDKNHNHVNEWCALNIRWQKDILASGPGEKWFCFHANVNNHGAYILEEYQTWNGGAGDTNIVYRRNIGPYETEAAVLLENTLTITTQQSTEFDNFLITTIPEASDPRAWQCPTCFNCLAHYYNETGGENCIPFAGSDNNTAGRPLRYRFSLSGDWFFYAPADTGFPNYTYTIPEDYINFDLWWVYPFINQEQAAPCSWGHAIGSWSVNFEEPEIVEQWVDVLLYAKARVVAQLSMVASGSDWFYRLGIGWFSHRRYPGDLSHPNPWDGTTSVTYESAIVTPFPGGSSNGVFGLEEIEVTKVSASHNTGGRGALFPDGVTPPSASLPAFPATITLRRQ